MLVVLALVGPGAAGPVRAGDALRPRTPVVHLDESCLAVVDRSADPMVHLRYTLPSEDLCEGAFGAPELRVVALCRPLAPGEALPQWITRDDVERAEAMQIPLHPVEPEDVLAEHPGWAGCWFPIEDLEEARPLDCEAARRGIDWDVSALPPGPYVVAAQTLQPPRNLWTPRWGVIDVDASPDPTEGAPVAVLANREAFAYADEVVTLRVCTSAMAGALVTVEYAEHGPAPAWSPAVGEVTGGEVPVEGGELELAWDPPAEVEGTDVRLRVTVRDPQGRATTLESPELLHVLAVPLPPGGNPTLGEPAPAPDTCRDAAVPSTLPCPTDPEASTGALEPGGEASEPAEGCACASAGPPRAPWRAWWALGPPLLLRLRLRGRPLRNR